MADNTAVLLDILDELRRLNSALASNPPQKIPPHQPPTQAGNLISLASRDPEAAKAEARRLSRQASRRTP